MNYLDIIIALPILWGIYRGFTKGFIISVASLLSLILGIYAAIHFASFFGIYIDKWFHPNPKHLKVYAFAVAFVLVVIAVRLIGWGLDRFVKTTSLGIVNRLAGVFFNVLKWMFILSVLISIIDSSDRTKNMIKEKDKGGSFLFNPVSKLAPIVFPYLKFDKIKEKLDVLESKAEAKSKL